MSEDKGMMNDALTYTVIGSSAFCAPQTYKNLTKEQAKEIAWELKNEQYFVTIEEEDWLLHEVGVCGNID